MNFFQRTFFKTLWQDKKMLIIAIAIALMVLSGFYTWFQIKRSWNWNVGGYETRAYAMVCNMAKKGVIAKGPTFEKECD